jgi:hypothetical protein
MSLVNLWYLAVRSLCTLSRAAVSLSGLAPAPDTYTRAVKSSAEACGYTLRLSMGTGKRESCSASPPFTLMLQICGRPLRVLRNTTVSASSHAGS